MTNIVLPLKHHAGFANSAADVEELSGVVFDGNVDGKVLAAAAEARFDVVDSADLGIHLVEWVEWNISRWRVTACGILDSCKCQGQQVSFGSHEGREEDEEEAEEIILVFANKGSRNREILSILLSTAGESRKDGWMQETRADKGAGDWVVQ